jgi:hypothetical protein
MNVQTAAAWLAIIAQLEPEAQALLLALISKLTGQNASDVATQADANWLQVAKDAQAKLDAAKNP